MIMKVLVQTISEQPITMYSSPDISSKKVIELKPDSLCVADTTYLKADKKIKGGLPNMVNVWYKQFTGWIKINDVRKVLEISIDSEHFKGDLSTYIKQVKIELDHLEKFGHLIIENEKVAFKNYLNHIKNLT